MDKNYEAIKEILEDQMKKIMKKGDITPQELDSLYKASAICLDFETKEAMKNAEKQEKEKGEYSQRGGSYDGHGYANDGYSTHYPWFMKGYGYDGRRMDYSNDGSYRGGSNDSNLIGMKELLWANRMNIPIAAMLIEEAIGQVMTDKAMNMMAAATMVQVTDAAEMQEPADM